MTSSGLVIVVQAETVDVRDVGVAGEMVAHRHPVLGFIPVNTGMEATQTPAVSPIKLQLSSNKTKSKVLPENRENCSTDELSQCETENFVLRGGKKVEVQ